jgi:BASS family bile acid:Na+ symporter
MEINIDTIVSSYATITLFLLMLSIGLREGFANLTLLWRRPGLLFRCVLASFVLVPIASMAIDAIFPLSDPVRAGMAAMAICPGAPMLYRKLSGMKANTALAGSYQVTMSLFAVVLVPLWIVIINLLYLRQNPSSISEVARQIAYVQLIPITAGMVIRGWVPSLADDLLEPTDKISSRMLLGILILIVIVGLPEILRVGVVTVLGVVLFIAATILIGHYLGGADPKNRIALALANSSRNAGLALALVAINFENEGRVLGTIGAIALLSAVAGAIYVNLYRKKLGLIGNRQVASND